MYIRTYSVFSYATGLQSTYVRRYVYVHYATSLLLLVCCNDNLYSIAAVKSTCLVLLPWISSRDDCTSSHNIVAALPPFLTSPIFLSISNRYVLTL